MLSIDSFHPLIASAKCMRLNSNFKKFARTGAISGRMSQPAQEPPAYSYSQLLVQMLVTCNHRVDEQGAVSSIFLLPLGSLHLMSEIA